MPHRLPTGFVNVFVRSHRDAGCKRPDRGNHRRRRASMAISTTRRGISAVTFALGLSLVLAACGGDDDDSGDGGDEDTSIGAGADCEALTAEYGDLSGTEITMYSTIIAPEDAPLEASFDKFEECTGTTIVYEGSDEFEAQLPVRVEAGTPPDMAILPQPGLLRTLVEDYPDAVVPAPEA